MENKKVGIYGLQKSEYKKICSAFKTKQFKDFNKGE